MKKICFGKNITTVNKKMSNLTDNIKSSLREVYRFPQNLEDVSNCFNGCVNLTKFEAELPNTIKNMSSSFEGCGNFYKNVAIPSDCIDMSRSFKGAGIKGSINIPDKVVDMRESFKDSKLEAVYFNENTSHFNNFQESFLNCKTLAYVYGNLPQNIVNAEGSFKNTGVTEVNFFRENSFINDASSMFSSCSNLKSVPVDLNAHYLNDAFNNCRNLETVGNIKSNGFSNTWRGCSNLKSIGIINGVLNFNNTFNGCSNYSNVVYLHPYFDGTDNSYLSIKDLDRNFLNNQALKIYGLGHGLENELNFQNAHLEKGDYISGYCDPDDFDNIEGVNFYNYNGTSEDLCIPKYFRRDLLDDTTKYTAVFADSFKGKSFNSVYLYGGNYENSFHTSKINNQLSIKSFANIGNNTFSSSNIKKFDINTQYIGNYSFSNATIENGFFHHDMLSIGESSFYNSNLGTINTYRISNIGPNAFRGSKNGTISAYISDDSITIGDIMENAFRDSSTVLKNTSYSLVGNIYNNAFRNSTKINEINLNTVKSIGEYAFYDTYIENLYVPDNIIFYNNTFAGMNSLTNLNVDILNIYPFGNFPSSLKDVVLRNPNQPVSSTNKLYSVENITMLNGGDITDYQFYGLSNLKIFNSYGLPNVATHAFEGCSNLSMISDLNNVKGTAFKNCYNLKKIHIKGEISKGALAGCMNLTDLEATINLFDWQYQGRCHHIGFLWDGNFINLYKNENPNYTPTDWCKGIILNYSDHSYYNYYYANISPVLTNANISIVTRYVDDMFWCCNMFTNIKSLKKVDFSYWWSSEDFLDTFSGCSNLTDLSIHDRWGAYLPNFNMARTIPSVTNLSFNTIGNYFNAYHIREFGRFISNLNTTFLKNLNISNIVYNYSAGISFSNMNIGNFSQNITVLPTCYHTNAYIPHAIYANFANSFSVRTNTIGIQSYQDVNKYTQINNFGMNLNDKTIYFDKNVYLNSYFLCNRSNLTLYLDVSMCPTIFFNNSNNITLYYSNLRPGVATSLVPEISNDGKNYYYSNNINIIYKPDYNYAKYVSNIK